MDIADLDPELRTPVIRFCGLPCAAACRCDWARWDRGWSHRHRWVPACGASSCVSGRTGRARGRSI